MSKSVWTLRQYQKPRSWRVLKKYPSKAKAMMAARGMSHARVAVFEDNKKIWESGDGMTQRTYKVPVQEHDAWAAAAERRGVSVSAKIRELMNEWAAG